jgi:hypothetical protein
MDERSPRPEADEPARPKKRAGRARRSGTDHGGRLRSVLLGPSGEAPVGAGVARALAGAAGNVRAPLASVARPVVESARPVLESVPRGVAGAVRRWRESSPGRTAQLRERGKLPLPSLWDVHSDARRAVPRELGLQTIALDEIRGTAVEGPVQRGGDFLPVPSLRGTNWLSRWQRIRRAVDRLEILPPIDVVKYGDGYWVVDGHNRVGAALYAGQVAIDASVVELRPLDGRRRSKRGPTPLLAELADESRDIRALGEGRFTRTATARPSHLEMRSGFERRSGIERRTEETGPPAEERRSDGDRRSGSDRRSPQ